MPPIKSFGERIADALVEDGLMSPLQVQELLELQKKEGTRLLKLILEKGHVSEVDMVVSMGRVLTVSPVNLARIVIPPDIANLVPREVATNHKVLPVSRLDNRMFLAMADPLNVLALDDIRRITKLEVVPLIASEKAILDKLHSLDSGQQSMQDIIEDAQRRAEDEAEADRLEVSREVSEEVNLDQLAASSEEGPVIRLANLIIVQAIKDRSSDIHIEPFEKTVRLRYRIDGALVDVTPPPKNMQVPLISRLKIMSNLDIAERRLPQDGRMRVRVSGRDIDLRVSILPTVHGEKCVLRILDKTNLSASLDKLGLDPDTFRRFKAAVDAPHGMILVTGPTGSGKTTTLYAALERLDTRSLNIMTVEDPIEYELPGVGQTQVNARIELTFAKALRAILRQDPDVIMIGEIRDFETAQIAIQASLTGHLVLATLHTNDAASAVTRLIDMGVEPFLLSSSLLGALAQRLVRKRCVSCHGQGCAECGHSGYQGRTGVFELLVADDALRALIHQQASEADIRAAALAGGMVLMRDDGERLVRAGITTQEELLRVTRD